jgi:flagellar protein FliO/FliZ
MTLLGPKILFARIAILLLCGLSGLAAAAPAPAAVQPEASLSATGEVLGILLPLALIIIALFAVLYFVRRRFGLTGQDAPLTILQILPVGSRERVVLVKSRSGRLFVVGVGSQSVTLITNLEQSDIETAAMAQTTPLRTTVIQPADVNRP